MDKKSKTQKPENFRPGSDKDAYLSQQHLSKSLRHIGPLPPSGTEQDLEPLAQRQRELRELEKLAKGLQSKNPFKRDLEDKIADKRTEIAVAETSKQDSGDGKPMSKTEIKTTAETSMQDSGDKNFMPRNKKELKRKYEELKKSIETRWSAMQVSQTPTRNLEITEEYIQLRDDKSELFTNLAYINKLNDFEKRFSQSIKKDNEMPMRPRTFEFKYELSWYLREFYPKRDILSKVQALPENGLGNQGESRDKLVETYKKAYNGFVSASIKLGNTNYFSLSSPKKVAERKASLRKTAYFYHRCIMDIERKIYIYNELKKRQIEQAKTQGQTEAGN